MAAQKNDDHRREHRRIEAGFRMHYGYTFGLIKREPLPLRRLLGATITIVVIVGILMTILGQR